MVLSGSLVRESEGKVVGWWVGNRVGLNVGSSSPATYYWICDRLQCWLGKRIFYGHEHECHLDTPFVVDALIIAFCQLFILVAIFLGRNNNSTEEHVLESLKAVNVRNMCLF